MKSFISPAARDDILRQYRYLLLEQSSPLAAERFLGAVRTSIRQLSKRPGIGAPLTLNNPRLAGIRSWPVDGFRSIRIYYLVVERRLRVVRVLYGKRDIHLILENESQEPS